MSTIFKVYGHNRCPYCDEAIRVLVQKNINFKYIDVKYSANATELAWLRSQGLTKVPQIYDGDIHVGGYEKLHAYLAKNHTGDQ